MGRSVKIKHSRIDKVKLSLRRNGFFSQKLLAEDLGKAASTVSNFFNGRAVDYNTFHEICHRLGLDEMEIMDLEVESEVEPPPIPVIPTLLLPLTEDRQLGVAFPSGTVGLNSPLYIPRLPAEEHCYREIARTGALIRIKAPRQLGKTSLMVRILHRAELQGDRGVYLSLQLTDRDSFQDSKTFLRWFATEVTEELHLPHQLGEYQKLAAVLSGTSACKLYFERYLLPELDRPLTLVIDEVDRVFEFPGIYSDFFGLLRVMNEKSKQTGIWQNLRLVISYSTEVYLPIDLNQSPFNVGIPIELVEFTPTQVRDLVARHRVALSETEIATLMAAIGGHPFLVRLALFYMSTGELTLLQLLETAWSPKGIYGAHLQRLEKILEQQSELKAAMTTVVAATEPVMLDTVRFKLDSLGLVSFRPDGVVPRCEVYRRYFHNR